MITKRVIVLSVMTSAVLMAGGYKLPEVSLNGNALGAAYIANTTEADTNYYNPANMAFLEEGAMVSGGLTVVHLPKNKFTSDLSPALNGESETENIVVPNLHYVAQATDAFRWGVSVVVPGGLTKRWETPYQKASAEEFTLKIVEVNPAFSYKVSDTFALGAGVRVIYSEGVVKSDTSDLYAMGLVDAPVSREMEGDDVAFGYNLAMTYKAMPDTTFAVTYRSNVDLKEEGTAKLSMGGRTLYDGDASVEVPLPAALNVAVAQSIDNLTLEFVYEKTFWSEYQTLDFEYPTSIGALAPLFDAPVTRDWKDTNTYRLGATYQMNDALTLMAGFALDETPAPVNRVGFELPDSDAKIYSAGFSYKQTKNLSWGASILYDEKEELEVSELNGKFTDGGAVLFNIGVNYRY
jgi:long-chain fatty acid transport protein